MPTLSVADGFEQSGTATSPPYSAIAGSPAIITHPVYSGNRALEIVTAVAEYVQYDVGASQRIVTTSFYIQLLAIPVAAVDFARFVNASGNKAFQFDTGTGKFRVSDASSVAGGPTLVTNKWYLVDLEADSSANPHITRCMIDGGTEFSVSNAIAASDTTSMRMGTPNAEAVNALYDDWAISITDGDYPIGPHAFGPRATSSIPYAPTATVPSTAVAFDMFRQITGKA